MDRGGFGEGKRDQNILKQFFLIKKGNLRCDEGGICKFVRHILLQHRSYMLSQAHVFFRVVPLGGGEHQRGLEVDLHLTGNMPMKGTVGLRPSLLSLFLDS